ncbi:MAG: radical SAM protein, partial [Granulosicoccaceae bacterium]
MLELLERNAARKGRGATSNANGRFEPYQVVACDDGWEAQPEPKLRTEWLPDNAKSVITRNTSPDIPFDR